MLRSFRILDLSRHRAVIQGDCDSCANIHKAFYKAFRSSFKMVYVFAEERA